MYPLIPLTTSLAIPTYYLILSISVCICLIWLTVRTRRFNLSRKTALDLSFIIMTTGFIGGRLFHVFYEDFSYYREGPLRVFQFWNGGFVFYGGALLAGISGLSFLYLNDKRHLKNYLDLCAPVLSLSYLLGRIACFFAGCCYGRYCDLPWSVSGRHPTQAYAAFWELGALIILIGIEKTPPLKRGNRSLKNTGSIFFLWMILHGLGRLLMENYRDDFRGPTFWFSISSWISILVIILGAFFLFRDNKKTA